MSYNSPRKFWKLWTEDLKVCFPKKNLTDALQVRWSISHSNVLMRLKKEKFMDFTSDLPFLYNNYGIGYTIEMGFFFDEEKFIEIREEKLKQRARSMGLSK